MSQLTLKDLQKRVSLEVGRSRNATQYFTVLIPYIIGEVQVVAIVLTPPTISIDVILAPTQYPKQYGVFTIQIPRDLLDSKNPDGTDKPFRILLNGHGLSWQQIRSTNTDRTLGLCFGASNGFLEIFGTKIKR
ncbi:MAG: hypothetical protein ACJ71F_14475 [Nitrososphaeraceae archaeon]